MRQGCEALGETEQNVVEEMLQSVREDHHGGERETRRSVCPEGTESATDAIARMWSTHETTLELLKLKDQLIDVERNVRSQKWYNVMMGSRWLMGLLRQPFK